MSDPYRVLGVSPNATDDQVKNAYREQARKYHPDNYAGNPLADLATEKMQEINQAYDQIMEQRRSGGQRSYQQSSGGQQQYRSGSQFADVRRLINQRRIVEAEELLDGVPPHSRDAEWFFLKGSVQYSRGWLDEALRNFNRAVELDPGNQEYWAALSQFQRQSRTGYHTSSPRGGECSTCDICTTLYCADCCCECMGGDLIRCC